MLGIVKMSSVVALCLWVSVSADQPPKSGNITSQGTTGFVNQSRPFDRFSMEKPVRFGFTFFDPSRFSMSQSYSTTFSSSSYGSNSYGLYLNTLSYQLFKPLVLSMDLGLYTPFYSSGAFRNSSMASQNSPAQFVMPRIGLDYQPSKNTHISIQFYNHGANQTYGYSPLGYRYFR